ncbi:MAG: hypothetical protein CFH30_00429 [Alphaproteobacteria bacterium MarineAlpha8_Bin1]|nr:MAG: hypothetical protein CFH30_00429 [Alphaproteobacteria bacterium MarineAlpha8_Bin1]|tara:strand:- start:1210 stop:1935 length:726 start_codon:yes stop_codon:yes gene_type:complete
MSNTFFKGLILSFGLHIITLSFFYFHENELQKTETSMTEVIIVSFDESNSVKSKSEYQKNQETISFKKKNSEVISENSASILSRQRLTDKNKESSFKEDRNSKIYKKKNLENSNLEKLSLEKLKENYGFLNKETAAYSESQNSKTIFQSSASYKIGSVYNPHPTYPLLARKKGWQGRIVLQVNVDKKGIVEKIEILKSSGHKILDKESTNTIKEWKFKPAMVGDKPVNDILEIPIRFVLDN